MGVIRHRHRFGESLGFVVDTSWPDGVHISPVRLGLRMHERVAVDLRGRSHEELRTLGLGQSETVVGPQTSDLEGLDWHLEVIDRRCW